MQKKLLTIVVAGAFAMPVAALAQVTVYGTIDGGLRNQSKAGPASGETNLVVTDGLRTTNRLGFRGSEDLGGGLMANFTMEGQHRSDTGDLDWNTARKSVVGLSKGGMSLDIGRDYTVNFKTQGIYDPMSYTYTGITPAAGTNTAGVRFSNLVTAGFRFGTGGIRVDYTTSGGQTASQDGPAGDDTGDGIGVNADFVFGPVTLGAAFSTVEANAAGAGIDTMNIGAAFKFGAFTIRAGWSNTENDATTVETPLWMVGLQYAISPTLNFRAGYYNMETETGGVTGQERKQMILALDYYLSKRTTAYVAVDRLDLNTGTVSLSGGQSGALGDGATGISVGLAHSF
ncbi:MAG: porin [Burkholderiales bacterium]